MLLYFLYDRSSYSINVTIRSWKQSNCNCCYLYTAGKKELYGSSTCFCSMIELEIEASAVDSYVTRFNELDKYSKRNNSYK